MNPPRRPCRALIFDFDGLLVDTETLWYEVMVELYSGFGSALSLDSWMTGVGTGLDEYDPFTELATLTGRDRSDLEMLGEEAFRRRMLRAGPMPGVTRCLATAKENGLRMAVASSSRRDSVVPHLVAFGLAGYFDHVLTAEDVTHVKPAPDLYLRAMAALGVSASEAVAFEDSANGLRAAKAAGLRCVVVPNRMTRGLDFTGCDLMLRSLADFSPGFSEAAREG